MVDKLSVCYAQIQVMDIEWCSFIKNEEKL